MRRVGVVVLVLLSMLVAAPAEAATPLRVMTFNIHTGIGSDGTLDLARTAGVIRAARADIVGLQEVDVHWAARSDFRDQARDLARMLGMQVFFAPIYDLPGQPRRQYGVAILSRFPVLHTTNHLITRLSTQEENPVPALAPGFAEALILVRGTPVHVYSTHLDYRADPAVRVRQVADTLRIMATDRGPQVLLGDLNAPPEAPALAPLWTELTDAAPAGTTYPADEPTTRIDYVAVSSEVVVVRAATVLPSLASDHRPVLADLAIRR